MTPDCAYLLDNGRRCRCAASHDSLFCRHHSPEALARRNHIRAGQPASSSPSQPSRWDLRAYWRLVHAEMPHCRYEALQDNFEGVLDALAQRLISPRCAGLILQAILDRLRNLAELDSETQLQQSLAALSRLVFANPDFNPSTSGQLPSFQANPAQSPWSQNTSD